MLLSSCTCTVQPLLDRGARVNGSTDAASLQGLWPLSLLAHAPAATCAAVSVRVFLFAASLLCNKALLHGHKRVQQGGALQSLQSGRPHYSSSAQACTCLVPFPPLPFTPPPHTPCLSAFRPPPALSLPEI